MQSTKDHDDFSDRKFRETLNITIINNFLDFQPGANYTTLSSFFHHMRNSFREIPHIFVSNYINENNEISEDEQSRLKNECNLSAAFTEWLMMWLLHVLRQECASPVHKECRDLFVSLLHLVRAYSPISFRQHVSRLLTLLNELNGFVDEFEENGEGNFKIQNYFLTEKVLIEDEELVLVDIAILFSNPNECENLQEKITSLLEILTIDITQFLPDKCGTLSKIYCLQIELGDLPLKAASLNALSTLVKFHGLMFTINYINYIFSCLQAVIIFCSSCDESVSNEIDLLEKSASLCLLSVVENIKRPENKFAVNCYTLGKLSQNLFEAVNRQRFVNTCKEFQSSFVKCIIILIEHGYENGYPIPVNTLHNFTYSLFEVFLRSKKPKLLVPLFVYLISSKRRKPSLQPCAKNLEEVSTITPESLTFENMKEHSQIWSLFYNLLSKKLNSAKVENIVLMKSFSACLEILVKSYCEIIYSEKKQYYQISCLSDTVANSNTNFLKLLSELLNCHLQYCVTGNFSLQIFEEIIYQYKVLLAVQDFISLTPEQVMIICNILSIPFLSYWKIEDFLDLQCPAVLLDIIKSFQTSFSSPVTVECLELLIAVSLNVCPRWRYHVFLFCMSHEDNILRTAAVKLMPSFLYSRIIPLQNIHDIIPYLMSTRSPEILSQIALIVGKISCVCSDACSLFRKRTSDESLLLMPEVLCKQCKKINDGLQVSDSQLMNSNDYLTDLFIQLLNNQFEMVKRACVLSIVSFFTHNKMSEAILISIMQLLVDPDSVVRQRFCNNIQYVVKLLSDSEKDNEWQQKIDEILITKLKAALISSKTSGNIHFQKTVVYSIGEIGKVADNGLLLITVISLLESYMTSVPTVKVVAFSKLKEIAEAKSLKMPDLFKGYKDPICKFVSQFLIDSSPENLLIVLDEIRTVFGFGDLKSFINQTQRFLLPYIVSVEEQHSSILLTSLSRVLLIDKSELLINNFPYIFSHFVRHYSKTELERALLLVQKCTNLELGSLLRCNYQLIHNELLLHLSTHYEQVFSGLAILALKSGNLDERSSRITHAEEMANYLQPKLLGFLVFFDAQMLKSTMDDKKLALESLVSIMKLMGNRAVTAVRFKLMATLRIALRFREGNFPKICCKAWNTFVHSIEVPYLGPLLNQIIVALLPLLELEPSAVSEIFHYLIIENRSYLSDYFHDLYFVPETPELNDINIVLKDYSESPSSITDFHSLLFHSLKGVSHENLEVRLHALEKLKQVLQANQTAIYEHLLGRESVDNLLSNLVAALISGCREPDIRVQIALGECLGELGAIDPGRLNTKNASSKETLNTFYSSIDNEDFAYALIQELVHSFLAADECGLQDCCACAIQEVLRFYKCSNEKGSSGSHLWKRFPPDIQEILAVLSHSQYKPLERFRKKFPTPIFQSKIGSSFRDWTKNWFCSLLQKVKKENPLKLFHACFIIVKYDLNCTLFLLPHLVVYALIDSTVSEREEICTEILTVLNHGKEPSSASDLLHLSCQTIFSVYDHLTKWMYGRKQELIKNVAAAAAAAAKKSNVDKNLAAIEHCLSRISPYLLAKSSFACKAYTRSLMHLEQHLKMNPDELENNISFLQKIYSALDEPDGVAGVAAARKEEASLMDLILENEAVGDMQAAFACYEKAINLYPDEVNYYGGLLKCFLGMDQPTTAVSYANGVLNDRPEWKEKLNRYRVEAAWKLANWQDLETFLQDEVNEIEWTVGVGNILYHANKKDINSIEKLSKAIKSSQMAPLSAASMEKGSYLRGYEHLVRMHMLIDLQLCINAIFDFNISDSMCDDTSSLFNIIPTLNLRRLLVQSSLRYQEPIHDLHRVLLKVGKEKFPDYSERFEQEIAKYWLQSAKLARKTGFQQRAYSCLLEAGRVNSSDLFMEKTKWLWSKGEKEQAIYCLQKGISEHFPFTLKKGSNMSDMSNDQQLKCAKAKLLLAIYSEESSIVDSSTLISMYKGVVVLQPNWEASHFHLAKYYDKVLNSCEEHAARAEIMMNVVHNFRLSLKHGCKNVYHSLPRLLDIWFDLGTLLTQDIHTLSKKYPNSWKAMCGSLDQISNMIIQDLFENVPSYLFLTAFPQMISRICHSHPSISTHLQKFISRILASYSQQAIWMMMAVSKSSYATRIKRCKQIFQEAILLNPTLGKFISDTTRLADKLIELSNKNVGECNVLNISENFPSLLKLIEEKNFSQIMLPIQNQMIVTLPSGFTCNADYNPFPFTPVYIKGFADIVEIFPSLQKPKKLTVIGSDGKLYPVMCKPKDDLRKDCRLMEFNNLVNRYLKSEPEARRRQLYIRTYAVVPLNEECGLIEWVPNLSGLRNILSRLYKMKGVFVTGREIRTMMPPKTASFEQKLVIFKTKFLPRFPSVFHDWFLITFSDPTAWYLARLAYARTTAVMSMVGYIVGLGDRHGENILFDSSCGDTVHVDLNCLFNKGETMECPEVVPFRLTHNMVHAMGPTGYEGAFRKACEVTMRVMRSRTDALMSVLRPFVHDPLLEWSRNKNAKAQQHESGEITNEQALTHVKDIELRLNGIIKTKRKQQGLPLSIEGQVNHLIQEAVDIRNLSQMYIGWAPYM